MAQQPKNQQVNKQTKQQQNQEAPAMSATQSSGKVEEKGQNRQP